MCPKYLVGTFGECVGPAIGGGKLHCVGAFLHQFAGRDSRFDEHKNQISTGPLIGVGRRDDASARLGRGASSRAPATQPGMVPEAPRSIIVYIAHNW